MFSNEIKKSILAQDRLSILLRLLGNMEVCEFILFKDHISDRIMITTRYWSFYNPDTGDFT